MSLGARLRELREGAGLSQEQIAGIAGVSRNAVSQWEADRTKPSTGRLMRVARALNVGIDELLATNTSQRRRVIAAAVTLLSTWHSDDITIEAICTACGTTREEFDANFSSLDELLHEVFCQVERQKLEEVQRAPPLYGTLATRLKYLLRQFLFHDLKHVGIMRLMHASSWTWDLAREREMSRQHLGIHDLIITCFDEAAAQGQIDPGNYRAASSLLLATYNLSLRKAIFDNSNADRVITFIEPQIAIILRAFGFRVVPGLAED